jgi:phosphoglycerol transferase MdoB-like AlkP superfamily enzyme
VVAVLGAFPGGASGSVMLVPAKSQQLPQIGQVLKANGYNLKFYYGGDEDFTNMRSYLFTGGFEQRVADRDFPISARLSKWGVPDHILFDYAAKDIVRRMTDDSGIPQFDVILSLSSHEPFEVDYHHYDHPYLNAIAYTDNCLGAFIDTLKSSPEWANTLVVLTADHGYPYPDGLQNLSPARYRIPLVFTGGAVAQPQTISTLGSQIDWVPTLLHQMHLEAEQFSFAKDLMDTIRAPYAYYHFVDGFAFITPADTTIIDAVTNMPVNTQHNESIDKKARAITQRIYESL